MSSSAGKIAVLLTALVVVGVIAALMTMLAGGGGAGGRSGGGGTAEGENSSTQNTTVAASNSATTQVALEIAVEDAADPWSRPDGTGCANEIVRAVFTAAKVPVALKVMPYARAKEMAMKGEIAACVAMSWSSELEGKIRFPDEAKSLYINASTFVENLAAPVKAKSIKDLPAGTTLGTVLNYEYPHPVSDLQNKGVIFDKNTSEEMNLKKLALGRLDLVVINIDDLKTADLLFSKAEVVGKVGVVLESFPQAAHIGFSVAHPQGDFARGKYNEGYAIVAANGVLSDIRAAWRAKYRMR
jgi:hypothetical protein